MFFVCVLSEYEYLQRNFYFSGITGKALNPRTSTLVKTNLQKIVICKRWRLRSFRCTTSCSHLPANRELSKHYSDWTLVQRIHPGSYRFQSVLCHCDPYLALPLWVLKNERMESDGADGCSWNRQRWLIVQWIWDCRSEVNFRLCIGCILQLRYWVMSDSNGGRFKLNLVNKTTTISIFWFPLPTSYCSSVCEGDFALLQS